MTLLGQPYGIQMPNGEYLAGYSMRHRRLVKEGESYYHATFTNDLMQACDFYPKKKAQEAINVLKLEGAQIIQLYLTSDLKEESDGD